MAKGLSPEFNIMGIMILIFGVLSLLLVMTLQPVHPQIVAVFMKYIWLFVGGAIVFTVIFSRIMDKLLQRDGEKKQ